MKATIRGIECEGTPEELAAFERGGGFTVVPWPAPFPQPFVVPVHPPILPLPPMDPWDPWRPPQITWTSTGTTTGGEA